MNQTIELAVRGSLGACVQEAVKAITYALKEAGAAVRQIPFSRQGNALVAGLSSDSYLVRQLKQNALQPPLKPESFVLSQAHNGAFLACGADERGLCYALYELAERLQDEGLQALRLEEPVCESPFLSTRVVGRFLMSIRDDGWFFNEDFWHYTFGRLIRCRYNRFTLIMGFDTAYMSPPYPFLIETPGYEQTIALVGKDPRARRERCRAALQRIGTLAHRYGLEFCLAIWQQKPWTDNQASMVENVPQDAAGFTNYAAKSITALLNAIPEIDALSFRVNLEAGVQQENGEPGSTAEDFWYAVIDGVRAAEHPVALELRAKGMTNGILDYALGTGLPVTVATKYWCEHDALPYHMLQMRTEERERIENPNSSRRYSYDDLPRHPRAYEIQYRLWNYGTHNLLLWGDPYHAERFIRSCRLGDASGFEISAPLSLKGGHATLPGEDFPIHSDARMHTYTYEDERYWMEYLCFGRMGYQPQTAHEVCERALRQRFGEYAPWMERAYLAASRVLPLITAAHFPVHPSLHYWPELYAGAALFVQNNYEPYFTAALNPQKTDFTAINSLPSDEALFCSIEQWVEGELTGQAPECYSPLQVRDWLKALSDQVHTALRHLEAVSEGEIYASAVDFTILADMAGYHAWKIGAAYHLCRYQKTQDSEALSAALAEMRRACACFEHLSGIGSTHYARNLVFEAGTSRRRHGNWVDWLEKQVVPDLRSLEELCRKQGVYHEKAADAYRTLQNTGVLLPVQFTDDIPEKHPAGKPLSICLHTGFSQALAPETAPVLHYRRTNQREGAFLRLPMRQTGESFRAVIPGEYLTPEYDLMVYVTGLDAAKNPWVYPGVWAARDPFPYKLIEIEE